jgi:hypothetical protein
VPGKTLCGKLGAHFNEAGNETPASDLILFVSPLPSSWSRYLPVSKQCRRSRPDANDGSDRDDTQADGERAKAGELSLDPRKRRALERGEQIIRETQVHFLSAIFIIKVPAWQSVIKRTHEQSLTQRLARTCCLFLCFLFGGGGTLTCSPHSRNPTE